MIRIGITALLVIAIVVLLLLFRVREVKVYGNERHSQGEIAADLVDDFLTENTLYLLWKYRDNEVPDTMPYLNSLSVQMKSPSAVEVQVSEKTLVGYIDKGEYIYFDENGLVLEITDQIYDGIPVVTGADTQEVVLYQKLPTSSSAQLRTILSLTQLLSYHELEAQEIRFGENMEITLFLHDVEVKLGQDEYLEEKIANLRAILEKMDSTDRGVLHLESFTGKNEAVTFTRSDEPVADTVQEDAAEDGTADGNADGSADASTAADGLGVSDEMTGDGTSDAAAGDTAEESADTAEEDPWSQPGFMVFNSSGTLVYNVRVINGVAVDEYGNAVPGCTVNENGYVVDAYMNVIDPATGTLAE